MRYILEQPVVKVGHTTLPLRGLDSGFWYRSHVCTPGNFDRYPSSPEQHCFSRTITICDWWQYVVWVTRDSGLHCVAETLCRCGSHPVAATSHPKKNHMSELRYACSTFCTPRPKCGSTRSPSESTARTFESLLLGSLQLPWGPDAQHRLERTSVLNKARWVVYHYVYNWNKKTHTHTSASVEPNKLLSWSNIIFSGKLRTFSWMMASRSVSTSCLHLAN